MKCAVLIYLTGWLVQISGIWGCLFSHKNLSREQKIYQIRYSGCSQGIPSCSGWHSPLGFSVYQRNSGPFVDSVHIFEQFSNTCFQQRGSGKKHQVAVTHLSNGTWPQRHCWAHINYFVLMAGFLTLRHFLLILKNCHVLVRTDNTTVIDHEGGTRSVALHGLAYNLMMWSNKQVYGE